MRTKKTVSSAFVLFVLSIILTSCDPQNPNNPNEQEVITSLKISAISTTDTVTFAYSDPDGNGGNGPTIDTAILAPSTIYTIGLELIDETKTPNDTITNAILSEGIDHQFFFTIAGANLTSIYADMDLNGKPIGLINTWTTTGTSIGTVVVILRHQPDKNGVGVSSGVITNAGGETDIEITFPIRIE